MIGSLKSIVTGWFADLWAAVKNPKNILEVSTFAVSGVTNAFFSAAYKGVTAGLTTGGVVCLSLACGSQIYAKLNELRHVRRVLRVLQLEEPLVVKENIPKAIVGVVGGVTVALGTLVGYDLCVYYAAPTWVNFLVAIVCVSAFPAGKKYADGLLRKAIGKCEDVMRADEVEERLSSLSPEIRAQLPPSVLSAIYEKTLDRLQQSQRHLEQESLTSVGGLRAQLAEHKLKAGLRVAEVEEQTQGLKSQLKDLHGKFLEAQKKERGSLKELLEVTERTESLLKSMPELMDIRRRIGGLEHELEALDGGINTTGRWAKEATSAVQMTQVSGSLPELRALEDVARKELLALEDLNAKDLLPKLGGLKKKVKKAQRKEALSRQGLGKAKEGLLGTGKGAGKLQQKLERAERLLTESEEVRAPLAGAIMQVEENQPRLKQLNFEFEKDEKEEDYAAVKDQVVVVDMQSEGLPREVTVAIAQVENLQPELRSLGSIRQQLEGANRLLEEVKKSLLASEAEETQQIEALQKRGSGIKGQLEEINVKIEELKRRLGALSEKRKLLELEVLQAAKVTHEKSAKVQEVIGGGDVEGSSHGTPSISHL